MGRKKEPVKNNVSIQDEEVIRSAALFPLENPSPVLRVDREGTILFSNRSAESLLASWSNDHGLNIPSCLKECIDSAIAGGGNKECLVEMGGRYVSFDVVPFPERRYANLYGRDVTERKLAEESLNRINEEWERTFDSVPDLIAIMDDSHHIIRVNRAMADRLSIDRENCIGTTCYFSVHGTDQPPHFCPHLLTLADGREHAAELHEKRLGGDFLVTTTPILDSKGERIGSVHVARDITERKRAEEALQVAKEAAEAANRAKGLFLANMSHELRTPLTGLLGMLDIARSGPLDERQREAIDLAQMSGQALLTIINDILDLSRIETGKLVIEEKPFSLRKCVEGSVEILLLGARSKGLDLKCIVSDDVTDMIIGDRVRIQQILTNLIGNAIKFTDSGTIEVKVAPSVRSREGKLDIAFSVKDTGIGIPEEKKDMIFLSFCQADESHSRRFGGTGLGLAISRELVHLMGGVIVCESREGEGSVFTFTIPLIEAVPYEIRVVDEKSVDLPEKSSALIGGRDKFRLLIAEDDEVTRKVLGYMLENSGFELEFAKDGLNAVTMWEKGKYDLIVMDGQMPGMDGFTATRAIREREQERGGRIPILAMTAHALKEDEERCLSAGMDAYVSKPINFGKCVEVINNLIAAKRGD